MPTLVDRLAQPLRERSSSGRVSEAEHVEAVEAAGGEAAWRSMGLEGTEQQVAKLSQQVGGSAGLRCGSGGKGT